MKRILVTGANKGIGLAIAEAILRKDEESHVLLGSRDAGRGEEALATLLALNPGWGARTQLVAIDVSSSDSVTAAATSIAQSFAGEDTPLFGIVNNAGVGFGMNDLEAVLQVNCYGMRRVCEAMIPLLQARGGRIVNITSAAGPNFVAECAPDMQSFLLDASNTWEKLESFMAMCVELGDAESFAARGLGDGNAYGLSKACANTYTLMLAREKPGLLVNACTPGFIATDLTRGYAEAANKLPEEMGMKDPAEGTASALHLLYGDITESGHYFGSDALRSPLDRYRAPGTPAFAG